MTQVRSLATNHRHASERYQRVTIAGKRRNPIVHATITYTVEFGAPLRQIAGTSRNPNLRTLNSVHCLDFGDGAQQYKVMSVSGENIILRTVGDYKDRARVHQKIHGRTVHKSWQHSCAEIKLTTVAHATRALVQDDPFEGGAA